MLISTRSRYRKRIPKIRTTFAEYRVTKTWSDSSMGFVSVSPLRRSAGHIAGYYRNGDGGGVAGGSVVVLRRWLLEEEPREDHPVAYSIWTCNGSTTSPRTAMWPMRNESSRHVTLSTTDRFGSARDMHARTHVWNVSHLLTNV